MELTKIHKITLGIVALLVLGFIIFNQSREKTKNTIEQNTPATTTTTIGESIQVTTPEGEKYTITPVAIPENKVSVPNLNRAVTTNAGVIVAPEAKALAIERVKITQTLLKKDTNNLSAWIDLGIYQKMGGDYDGAILSWKYVSQVANKDFVSLGNLGNLSAYFLNDMVNAEKYYNQAIKNAPTQIHLYFQLAEAFRDVSNDMTKARAVVARGLTANPGNQELLALKASLN